MGNADVTTIVSNLQIPSRSHLLESGTKAIFHYTGFAGIKFKFTMQGLLNLSDRLKIWLGEWNFLCRGTVNVFNGAGNFDHHLMEREE